MLFENDYEGFEYSARGTVFLCSYRQHLYAVTAAHVVRDFDPDAVRILVHPENREFLPHKEQVKLSSHDLDDPDFCDIAIFPIEKNMVNPDCFLDCPPFFLDETLVNSEPPRDGRLVFRGFPTDQSGIEFDNKRICLQAAQIEGERIGRASMDHCHEILLHDVDHCTTLDGFSGSPIFWISNNRSPRTYYFAGVLIRGSLKARKAIYIGGGVLIGALNQL